MRLLCPNWITKVPTHERMGQSRNGRRLGESSVRSPRSRWAVPLAVLVCTAEVPAQLPTPAMQREVVAQTKWFRFHSDSLMGLHDWLNWRTSGLPNAPAEACAANSVRDPERRAFERAQEFYSGLRGRDRDRYLIAIRYELAGYPDLEIVADSIITRASGLLRDALPAYLACWWREHDRRNREFIAQLVPGLRIHEDSIAARLARAYQADWSGQFPVDLMSFATATGANSVVDPNHIIMSSNDSSYRGASGIEMVFHEASHSVVDSGRDIIRRLLRDSTVTGGARLPRELSHVLLFYSVGRITADVLGEAGASYEPYMSREGLWQRAWPRLRAPVEQYWQGYLAGRTTARDAMMALIKALPPGGEPPRFSATRTRAQRGPFQSSAEAKNATRSISSGATSSRGRQRSTSARISGRSSSGRQRSTTRASGSMIQYSGTRCC